MKKYRRANTGNVTGDYGRRRRNDEEILLVISMVILSFSVKTRLNFEYINYFPHMTHYPLAYGKEREHRSAHINLCGFF